jgi:hypothetical protein
MIWDACPLLFVLICWDVLWGAVAFGLSTWKGGARRELSERELIHVLTGGYAVETSNIKPSDQSSHGS